MAVSKVIIICGLIGFLSGLVSNHPIKRRSENAQYLFPKTLEENNTFDMKLNKTNNFVIRLVTSDDKIAYTFTVELHEDKAEEDNETITDSEFYLRTHYGKFIENSTVAVNFAVMKGQTGLNVISIGGPTAVIKEITIKDMEIDDIKHFTVTGKGEEDIKVLQLIFGFSQMNVNK